MTYPGWLLTVCLFGSGQLAGGVSVGFAADSKLEINLAPIEIYSNEADATRQCRPDIVVWADSGNGYFYSRRDAEFGTSPAGAYACMKTALAANYWDRNPFSNMRDKGRSFPINPDLLCLYCS